MSMAVDFSTPLTEDERKFLNERGRYSDIERADSAHGGSAPEGFGEGDGTGPQYRPVLQGEAAAARKAQLLAELEAIEATEAAETGRDGSVEDGDVDPYEVWTPEELTKELKRRKLTATGSKEDKVARLYEDDEKSSGNSQS